MPRACQGELRKEEKARGQGNILRKQEAKDDSSQPRHTRLYKYFEVRATLLFL